MSVALVDAAAVDQGKLHSFLGRFYSSHKAAFLRDHGEWWHRGNSNRWILVEGGEIFGYCAVIPTRVGCNGDEVAAVWWVDLIVAPEARGRGLQRLFDSRVREAAPLVLGFPNALAARIHRRHGWGVREDLRVRVLPLYPFRMGVVANGRGVRGLVVRGAAALLSPLAALTRYFVAGRDSSTAWLATVDAEVLAKLHSEHGAKHGCTTVRDRAHYDWRYVESPDSGSIDCVLAGEDRRRPSIAVLSRTCETKSGCMVRILDVIGDLGDRSALGAALRVTTVLGVERDASHVTALATTPRMNTELKRAGFLVAGKSRFCWLTSDRRVSETLGGPGCFWVLGDSDNDDR